MDSLNVLFWNIGKQNSVRAVAAFAARYNADVLVLIEDINSPTTMLNALNESNSKYYFCHSNNRKISIYTSFDRSVFNIKPVASPYISVVEFAFANKPILLVAIHLPSKLTIKDAAEYSYHVRQIKNEIEAIESTGRHSNTIIVGDFNMNPFESAMVEPEAFNAVMCRSIAAQVTRKITGRPKSHNYFYNPMWSFMGDLSNYTPGTYYYYGNSFDNHYKWNMLDQVLIRPDLISNFVSNSLEIIDRDIHGKILIDASTKTRSKYQFFDHLPVFFSLDLTK